MKIIVLGATGMLGHKVYLHLKTRDFAVKAIMRKHWCDIRHLGIFDEKDIITGVDVSNESSLLKLLGQEKPDVIINCVGKTTRRMDDGDADKTVWINAYLPHCLHHWCRHNQSRLIHFSTDCVFSGLDGPYVGTDVKDANDLYGLSKSLGEVEGERAVTIRSSIVGREIFNFTELFEWAISQQGQKINGFSQVYYSGVTTNFMAKVVEFFVTHPEHHGIFQVASEKVSKYQLLSQLSQALNLNLSISKESSKKSNKVLISNEFEKISGMKKPKWKDMLKEINLERDLYESVSDQRRLAG